MENINIIDNPFALLAQSEDDFDEQYQESTYDDGYNRPHKPISFLERIIDIDPIYSKTHKSIPTTVVTISADGISEESYKQYCE